VTVPYWVAAAAGAGGETGGGGIGAGGSAIAAGGSSAATGVPQERQKAAAGTNSLPHAAQVDAAAGSGSEGDSPSIAGCPGPGSQ
jgi:hypothetical protein